VASIPMPSRQPPAVCGALAAAVSAAYGSQTFESGYAFLVPRPRLGDGQVAARVCFRPLSEQTVGAGLALQSAAEC
jgi:hypothetical protein